MFTNHAARTFNWRLELPMLSGSLVTLREPLGSDGAALLDLFSLPDAARFDLAGAAGPTVVSGLIERAARERADGVAFTYAVVQAATGATVGLFRVRQLDPFWEAAIWDCTIVPSVRGTGVFIDAARLVASFAFASAGVRRLEARVDVNNARAKAALVKLGGVQEGILRRAVRRGNDYVDQALWAVVRDAWESPPKPAPQVVH
jgi:ribosomal-protein-alanine N-acetyltransferase